MLLCLVKLQDIILVAKSLFLESTKTLYYIVELPPQADISFSFFPGGGGWGVGVGAGGGMRYLIESNAYDYQVSIFANDQDTMLLIRSRNLCNMSSFL